MLQKVVENRSQYLEITSLGIPLAETVIEEWLKSSRRTLSSRQMDIVKKALNKSTLPIFVKLVFATICRWKSYSRPQDTILASTVHESVQALFERTENQHGKLLVSHALSYITAAKCGISESELEDLISLDDKVLDDVYQYHLPPVRRIPPLLWTRIRADLPGYLSERDANGVIVLNWYHRQFYEAARERFFKSMNHVHFTHSSMADYFLGLWGGVPKPFQFTQIQRQRFGILEKEGLADRKVPVQPNVFPGKGGKPGRYNVRKLTELPYHLLRAERHEELLSRCLFNYEFLQSKICSFPLQDLLADFDDALQHLQETKTRRELVLVADCLRLSASILNRYPYMLPFELSGRLLPLINDNERVKSLLIQCDTEGIRTSCIVPVHHCFHSPGGPLKYSLEEHPFAVFGMQLTSDEKTVVSVSNILIVWDIESGDVARIVRPGMDGIMFALALSPNDKFAATYTNNNEVCLISMVTGDYQLFQPDGLSPKDQMMIIGIALTESELIFWTKNEIFVYDLNGAMKKVFGLSIPSDLQLLNMFYENEHEYHLVSWKGGKEDTKIHMQSTVDDVQYSDVEFESAMTFFKDKRQIFGCSSVAHNEILLYSRGENGWKHEEKFHLKTGGDEERVIAMSLSEGEKYLVGIEGHGYNIWRLSDKKLFRLKLPDGVRNIPLRPMLTTSPTAFIRGLEYFAAGVRKNLYIFEISTERLVQTIDAHFGRILNLIPIPLAGGSQKGLLTASIDHSIKIWNINNIFEKSYKIERLEKAVEKILIAKNNQLIVAVQTRKYIALWDITRNSLLGTLAASQHGAVVTHSLVTEDAGQVISVESETLLLWDVKTQSVRNRQELNNISQIFFLKQETMLGILIKHETDEAKMAKLQVRFNDTFEIVYEFQFLCRFFHQVIVMKGEQFLVAIALVNGKEFIQVIHAETGATVHRIRLRKGRDEGGFSILLVKPMPHNPNQLVVVDSDHRGYIFDIKNKRLLRSVSPFSGACSSDGKFGVHAPPRGGLEIIDLRKGQVTKILIPKTFEGVHDIVAEFSPCDRNILYYHSGQKTLKVFRVADGNMIGCFRPHAKLTSLSLTRDGCQCLIGGEDGSLLITALIDPGNRKSLEMLAKQPTRKALAQNLGIESNGEDAMADLKNKSFGNLKTVGKAVNKFKRLADKEHKSSTCCLQ